MLVHLNGQLVPAEGASVSAFDRAFLFGDAVYEGIRACSGVAVAMREHLDRMRAGLREARIAGFEPDSLVPATRELLAANNLADASIYWQVSRGAPGAFTEPASLRARIPSAALRYTPTVFGYVAPLPPLAAFVEPATKSAIALPDLRWLRCHLKSTSLMGASIGAMEAAERASDDAIFIRDGMVAEALATNVFIARAGRVITPPDTPGLLLSGVTRNLLLQADPTIHVANISERDLREADEVMLAGTFTMVASVTRLNGEPVGSGSPGPKARALLQTLVRVLQDRVARAG